MFIVTCFHIRLLITICITECWCTVWCVSIYVYSSFCNTECWCSVWRVPIYVYSSPYVLQKPHVQCDVIPYTSTHHYVYYRMPMFSVTSFHIRQLISIMYYRMLMFSVTCSHIRLLIIMYYKMLIFSVACLYVYSSLYVLQKLMFNVTCFHIRLLITIYINECWCLVCRVSIYPQTCIFINRSAMQS